MNGALHSLECRNEIRALLLSCSELLFEGQDFRSTRAELGFGVSQLRLQAGGCLCVNCL